MIVSLPTLLSLVRMALAPFFMYFFLQGSYLVAVLIFTVAALSDAFDGYIARKYDMTSQLGAFIDPLADKVLIATALLCFILKDFTSWWVLGVIVGRDVLVTWLRIAAQRRGAYLVTTRLAQYKTAAQMCMIYLAFVWLIIHDSSSLAYPGLELCVKVFFYGVVTLTAYTGADYVYRYLRLGNKGK
ncbi:MAG: CDP-diacylglycerol--glycerol-3-phosphate 3-phosphatidyltransferase [Candidatus Babeliales bacterium]